VGLPGQLHLLALSCTNLRQLAEKKFSGGFLRVAIGAEQGLQGEAFLETLGTRFHDGRSRNGLLYFDGSGL
jgi:hypothetical protein